MNGEFNKAHQKAKEAEAKCQEKQRITLVKRGEVERSIDDVESRIIDARADVRTAERKVSRARTAVSDAEDAVRDSRRAVKNKHVLGTAGTIVVGGIGATLGCLGGLMVTFGNPLGCAAGGVIGAASGGLMGTTVTLMDVSAAERVLQNAQNALRDKESALREKESNLDSLEDEQRDHDEAKREMTRALGQVISIQNTIGQVLTVVGKCTTACANTWVRAEELNRHAQGQPVFLRRLAQSVMELITYFPELTNLVGGDLLQMAISDTSLNDKMALIIQTDVWDL